MILRLGVYTIESFKFDVYRQWVVHTISQHLDRLQHDRFAFCGEGHHAIGDAKIVFEADRVKESGGYDSFQYSMDRLTTSDNPAVCVDVVWHRNITKICFEAEIIAHCNPEVQMFRCQLVGYCCELLRFISRRV